MRAAVVAGPSGTAGRSTRRSGVKGRLTGRRGKRVVENPEFAQFARRILRACGRRIADGDVEGLAGLVALRSEVDEAIGSAVRGLKAEPWSYSWADVARVLGTTRQAAQQRYGTN